MLCDACTGQDALPAVTQERPQLVCPPGPMEGEGEFRCRTGLACGGSHGSRGHRSQRTNIEPTALRPPLAVRPQAIEIRVLFEKNRDIRDPRRVATMLKKVEDEMREFQHPDPYRRECRQGGLSCAAPGAPAATDALHLATPVLARPPGLPTTPSPAPLFPDGTKWVGPKATHLHLSCAQV